MTSDGHDEQSVDALWPGQPTERRGLVTRIRTARSIAPELVALGLLYLGGLGADWGSVVLDVRVQDEIIMFFAGLLGFLAPALIVLGSFVIWLSPRPTPVEKWIAAVSAILFPLVLSQISPSLSGRYESCQAGSGYDPNGKQVTSYSYCSNGPNWVTHTVEWTWVLLPLVLSLTLATLSLRRKRREQTPALAG
ncbi:MAG: hypothetical protein QOG80_3264 [Pseudonocardiales bacterium]|nr:hypothetical protein [Pseudonocardiales bacterium]